MKWFNDMGIGAKLVMSFLVMALVTAFVGGLGVSNLSTMNDSADRLYKMEMIGLENVDGAHIAILDIIRAEKNAILAKDSESVREFSESADVAEKRYEEELGRARQCFYTDAGKAKVAEVEKAGAEFLAVHHRVMQMAARLDQVSKTAASELSMTQGRSAVKRLNDLMVALTEMKLANGKAAAQSTAEMYASTRNLQIGIIVVAVIVSLGWGMVLSRMIGGPLNQLTAVANRLAEGDVDQRVEAESKDEVGQLAEAFGKMILAQKELAAAAARVGAGDMTTAVKVRSEKDVLAHSLQHLQRTIQNLMEETHGLVDAARHGQLSMRGQDNRYEGAFRQLVASINGMLDTIVAPVREASRVLGQIAERDLTSRVQGNYEGDFDHLKEAINTAVRNLDEALSHVAAGADQVAAASEQISHGSQGLASSTSQQAASIEEVSASVQQMASMAHQNSSNSREARAMADNARHSADAGMDSMRKLAEAVDKIRESSDSTARILKTIDEIAFQTNLLALNAAVEAARAGDAGKGFAVVAEEVRNLAMRSAEAARNTASLIEDSVRNARAGVDITGEVSTRLQEIHQHNTRVSEVMAEIAAASEQQTQGIDQVTRAIDELNRTTQHAAATSEESASAAEELSGQAAEMRATVSNFRLSTGSSPSRPSHSYATKLAGRTVTPPPMAMAGRSLGNGNGNGHGHGHAGARLTESMKERMLPLDDDPSILGQF